MSWLRIFPTAYYIQWENDSMQFSVNRHYAINA